MLCILGTSSADFSFVLLLILTLDFSGLTANSYPDYRFFDASNEDEGTAQAKAVGAREKQYVLEAAGFMVNREVGPAPLHPKAKRTRRRPARAALSYVSSIVTRPTARAQHRARNRSQRNGT